MFLKLFFALKAARLPVSLREHLTLIEAMDEGLVTYDIDGFYYLARAALVKDERHLDLVPENLGAYLSWGQSAEAPGWLRERLFDFKIPAGM